MRVRRWTNTVSVHESWICCRKAALNPYPCSAGPGARPKRDQLVALSGGRSESAASRRIRPICPGHVTGTFSRCPRGCNRCCCDGPSAASFGDLRQRTNPLSWWRKVGFTMLVAQIGDCPLGSFWDVAAEAAKSFLKEEGTKLGTELLKTGEQALLRQISPGGGSGGGAPSGSTTSAASAAVGTAVGARPVTVAMPPAVARSTGCYFEVAGMRHACTHDGWLGAVAHARSLAQRGQTPVFVLFVDGQRINLRRCVLPSGQLTTPQALQCPAGYVLARDSAGRAVCMPQQPQTSATQTSPSAPHSRRRRRRNLQGHRR